jgi:uncharacterized protein DUF3237
MAGTSISVEHLFTMTATTRLSAAINGGPQGTRRIVDASTGTFEGPRLKGTITGPGGDWVTTRADGSALLDVRLLLETDDGAWIFMKFKGILTEGGARLRTAPLFETGDQRYTWLNAVQAVALGAVGDGSVTYDVYQVL